MIRINLIPYRDARSQAQILQHVVVALMVLGTAALLSFGTHIIASGTFSSLQSELSTLRAENQSLKKKIGKIKNLDKLRKDVERKLGLVDDLQRGRFRSMESLIAIAELIPENVWLTGIKDSGGSISLSGLGESNKAVANFMRSMEKSPTFGGVTLKVIKRTKAGKVPVRAFELSMERLSGKEDEDQAKKSGKKRGKK
ncbi:MAG: PilN domain-containing protein [Mariprofundaceae bacterium]